MRPLALAALAAALTAALLAPAAAPAATLRLDERVRGWQFQPDPRDRGLRAGWHRGARRGGWRAVTLPHVVHRRPVERTFGGSVAWYRLRFTASSALQRRRPVLRFEQARREATVWLNGRRVGGSGGVYAPFEVDLPRLREGTNEVLVRVDGRRPEGVREGWWTWTGLTRPVTAVARGRVALRDVGFVTRRPGGDVVVLVTGTLENRTTRRMRPRVAVNLVSPDGTRVVSRVVTPAPLRPRQRRAFRLPVSVGADAPLWSPRSPALWSARVETKVGVAVESRDRARIGLRTVSVEPTDQGGRLRLNGEAVPLVGAGLHEDLPRQGAALSDAGIERLVQDLKDVGANVTRSHYPLDERLLRRLDEEGILVWDEAPLYHPDRALERRGGLREALDTVEDTVVATRNHPSVLVHSVVNEPDPLSDRRTTGTFIRRAAALARRLDPSVPTAANLVGFPNYPRQRSFASVDVLGLNAYYGWYRGRAGEHSIAEFDDLAPYLRETRRQYPDQSLLVTEFGAEASFEGPADEKGSFAFQEAYLRRYVEVLRGLGFVDGAIWWALREFAVKPDWFGGGTPLRNPDGIHRKGLLVYETGERKPAWGALREAATTGLGP